MSEGCNQEHRFETLKRELTTEFEKTKHVVHKLIDDLTAISGYAAIAVIQGGPEQTLQEFRKILDRSKKSIVMLQDCVASLHELGRRYS